MRSVAARDGLPPKKGAVCEPPRDAVCEPPRDLAALDELYQEHVGRVHRWIRSQVRDDAAAEDLTAQVFFRACASSATYRGEGTYQSWLFRIARNCVCDHRAAALRVVPVPDAADEADPSPSPSALAIAKEDREVIWDLVSKLPEAERRAIALRYLHEMSVEEMSKILSRTRGAVRVLLHRARKRLRGAIEKVNHGDHQ